MLLTGKRECKRIRSTDGEHLVSGEAGKLSKVTDAYNKLLGAGLRSEEPRREVDWNR